MVGVSQDTGEGDSCQSEIIPVHTAVVTPGVLFVD